MNTETVDLGAVPLARGAPGALRTTLVTLIRREFWEHAALWRAPAIVAALLMLVAVFSTSIAVNVNDTHVLHLDPATRIIALNMTQMVWTMIIYLVAAVVVTFYTLDCLYTERRDRSILFWKSLPVSDGLTVLAKFLVASAVVPLLVFVLATASHLVALIVWKLRVTLAGAPDLIAWDALAWLRGEAVMLLALTLSSLWYAPLVAAALLVSAWVRRSPVLWATLPLIVLPIFEYLFFRTHYLWSFIKYRSGGIWHLLGQGGHPVDEERLRLLSDLNWVGAFLSPDLWLGLAAAAALLYAAARVRRYRDDT